MAGPRRAAEWYFQSIARRRLVYSDLEEAFPLFYGKGRNPKDPVKGKTMRPMSGERGTSYEVDWLNAWNYFKAEPTERQHTPEPLRVRRVVLAR
mgnify:CR=1 FL=1